MSTIGKLVVTCRQQPLSLQPAMLFAPIHSKHTRYAGATSTHKVQRSYTTPQQP